MVMAALVSAETRASLIETFVKKAEQACFIDWVVGVSLALYYAPALVADFFGEASYSPNMWYAVAALGCTRTGDTVVRAVSAYVKGKYDAKKQSA